MAEPRPVEGDGAMGLGRVIDKATDEHVVDHRPVAVQEDDGRACAALHVVQSYAIRGNEWAPGRIVPLGLGRSAIGQ